MHDLTSMICAYLLNSLWMTPLLWTAGCFVCWVLKPLGPSTTHRVWVFVLFAAVLAPSLPIGGALLHPADAAGLSTVGAMLHLRVSIISSNWNDAPGPASLPHGLLLALSVTYLCLFIFFFGRLWRRVLRTSRLVRRAHPCTLPPTFEVVRRELARCFRVDPLLLETDELPGPVTAGVQRPVLLLPSGFVQAAEINDFRVAVAHECVHLARYDFFKNLCYQFLSLPIAFHPFSWLMQDRIAQSRELLCDRIAVDRSVDARVYVRSLLRLAMLVASGTQAISLNAIGIHDANILEKRVMELRTAKAKVTLGVRLGLLPVGLFCLAAVIVAGVAAPIAATGTEPAPIRGSDKVFHVGKDVSAPVLVRQADPEFPATYKKPSGTMSGTCEVGMIVDTSGTPRKVHVAKSFNPIFDKEAIKAVEQYRFKPALRAGKPVSVDLFVDINFQKF